MKTSEKAFWLSIRKNLKETEGYILPVLVPPCSQESISRNLVCSKDLLKQYFFTKTPWKK